MSNIKLDNRPQLAQSFIDSLESYLSRSGLTTQQITDAASALSAIDTAGITYETTNDTRTNRLAALWASIQVQLNAHTAIFTSAGYTNPEIANIATTYGNLIS